MRRSKYAGLRLSIVEPKDIGNCSNDGVSARCKSVTVVANPEDIDLPEHVQSEVRRFNGRLVSIPHGAVFEPSDTAPAVVLVDRGRYGVVAVPLDKPDGAEVGPMMGGCYVATSDSRFGQALVAPGEVFGGAVPLHDRFETQALYDALSR